MRDSQIRELRRRIQELESEEHEGKVYEGVGHMAHSLHAENQCNREKLSTLLLRKAASNKKEAEQLEKLAKVVEILDPETEDLLWRITNLRSLAANNPLS